MRSVTTGGLPPSCTDVPPYGDPKSRWRKFAVRLSLGPRQKTVSGKPCTRAAANAEPRPFSPQNTGSALRARRAIEPLAEPGNVLTCSHTAPGVGARADKPKSRVRSVRKGLMNRLGLRQKGAGHSQDAAPAASGDLAEAAATTAAPKHKRAGDNALSREMDRQCAAAMRALLAEAAAFGDRSDAFTIRRDLNHPLAAAAAEVVNCWQLAAEARRDSDDAADRRLRAIVAAALGEMDVQTIARAQAGLNCAQDFMMSSSPAERALEAISDLWDPEAIRSIWAKHLKAGFETGSKLDVTAAARDLRQAGKGPFIDDSNSRQLAGHLPAVMLHRYGPAMLATLRVVSSDWLAVHAASINTLHEAFTGRQDPATAGALLAQALRTMLDEYPDARADANCDIRLTQALMELHDDALAHAAQLLLGSGPEYRRRMAELRSCIEEAETEEADRAVRSRQFDALRQNLQRVVEARGVQEAGLDQTEWRWMPPLSRHDAPPVRRSLISRIFRPVGRLLRRATAFTRSRYERTLLNDAREDCAAAAWKLVSAVCEPAGAQSARLEGRWSRFLAKAGKLYELETGTGTFQDAAFARTESGEQCKALFGAYIFQALARVPGAHIDAIGRRLDAHPWLSMRCDHAGKNLFKACLREALLNEPAVRAATEMLREVPPALDAARQQDRPAPAAAPEVLMTVLEQRFRPRDLTLEPFLLRGLRRLGQDEKARLYKAVRSRPDLPQGLLQETCEIVSSWAQSPDM